MQKKVAVGMSRAVKYPAKTSASDEDGESDEKISRMSSLGFPRDPEGLHAVKEYRAKVRNHSVTTLGLLPMGRDVFEKKPLKKVSKQGHCSERGS